MDSDLASNLNKPEGLDDTEKRACSKCGKTFKTRQNEEENTLCQRCKRTTASEHRREYKRMLYKKQVIEPEEKDRFEKAMYMLVIDPFGEINLGSNFRFIDLVSDLTNGYLSQGSVIMNKITGKYFIICGQQCTPQTIEISGC